MTEKQSLNIEEICKDLSYINEYDNEAVSYFEHMKKRGIKNTCELCDGYGVINLNIESKCSRCNGSGDNNFSW